MPSANDVDRFLANPCDYFDHSRAKAMSVPRAELDGLQLAALQNRFKHFRGRLPMMDKLADLQNVNAIEKINDVLPLLFDHATYKSYPSSLLEKHKYPQLTTWLGKLTTIDLSTVDVSKCRSIDDWLITLNRETPLAVCHTSGTSGSMSFLPWSKVEWNQLLESFAMLYCEDYGPQTRLPLDLDCIYPFFRSGGLSHTVINDAIVHVIAGAEERLHAAYPQRLSADLLLMATRRRVAAAKGTLDTFAASPELEARHEEFAKQQREMPDHIVRFFEDMRSELADRARSRDLFDLMALIRNHGFSLDRAFQHVAKLAPIEQRDIERHKAVLTGVILLDEDDEGFEGLGVVIGIESIYQFFGSAVDADEQRLAKDGQIF